MSCMIEVYYREPTDEARENRLVESAKAYGGRLDYRESPDRPGGPVCLTFEFSEADQALAAAESLRGHGEHVEGPADYGAA